MLEDAVDGLAVNGEDAVAGLESGSDGGIVRDQVLDD